MPKGLQHYIDKFNISAARFDKDLFTQKDLEYKVGRWVRSAALKIQKRSWK